MCQYSPLLPLLQLQLPWLTREAVCSHDSRDVTRHRNLFLSPEPCDSIAMNGTNGPRFHLGCKLSLLAYHFNRGLGGFKITLEDKIQDLFWRGSSLKNRWSAFSSVPRPATEARVWEAGRLAAVAAAGHRHSPSRVPAAPCEGCLLLHAAGASAPS